MTYYIGVVDRGGEGYGIWFPDLPGCTSGGKTLEALFANGMEALALWAGEARACGEALPAPRALDAIAVDGEVIEAAAEIGPVSFLQVPLVLEANRPVRANLSLDAGLLEVIDAAARASGLTRSAFLAGAAMDKIKRL